jgi:hypothetical protein
MTKAEEIAATRAKELAELTKGFEQAYADASRYEDNTAVMVAVANLKKAHAELVIADADLTAVSVPRAKGWLSLARVSFRCERAFRAARRAYTDLRLLVPWQPPQPAAPASPVPPAAPADLWLPGPADVWLQAKIKHDRESR